jgi:hypothetical protein
MRAASRGRNERSRESLDAPDDRWTNCAFAGRRALHWVRRCPGHVSSARLMQVLRQTRHGTFRKRIRTLRFGYSAALLSIAWSRVSTGRRGMPFGARPLPSVAVAAKLDACKTVAGTRHAHCFGDVPQNIRFVPVVGRRNQRASRGSDSTAPAGVRAAGPSAGAGLRVDSGLLSLGRPCLRVGARSVGRGALARSAMGATALGPPARGLGVRRRPLAVSRCCRRDSPDATFAA